MDRPGSAKTTLSRAIAECLRTADLAHAVIDLDDLCKDRLATAARSEARTDGVTVHPGITIITFGGLMA